MKFFKNFLNMLLAALLIIQFSCKEEQEDYVINDNSIADEIAKIETVYQEGAVKIETCWDSISPKIETIADDITKQILYAELESSFATKQVHLKSYSNPVGVIQGGWCSTNTLLTVFMDCEDHNEASSTNGWVGNIEKDSNGNLKYNFCIVDGSLLHQMKFNYAVLDLSGNIPSNAVSATRYFDNEDDNNKNKVTSDGVTITGTYGSCYFDRNIQLGFQFYPALASSQYTSLPDFGIGSYGVFGSFNSVNSGYVYSDDEDHKNANKFTTTLSQAQYSSFIEVGSNTKLYVSKAY
jgi:hypothetical protein